MIPDVPQPREGTLVRIEGPFTVSGMKVWRVYDVTRRPWRKVGPDCFSWSEARNRADDAANGSVTWFGNTRLAATPYYGREHLVESGGDLLK